MATCLGKSCSFGLPRVPFVNCCQFMYLVVSLLIFGGGMWGLIVSVPDQCLSFYLTLEGSEIFLSLAIIFSLEKAAVVWAILERISGFDPSLEMIVPMFLKFFASFSF